MRIADRSQGGRISLGRLIVFLVVVLAVIVGWRLFLVWRTDTDTVRVIQGIDVSYILTPRRAAAFTPPFSRDFDVTSSGNIIIGDGEALLELESDGGALTVDKVSGEVHAPDSFALDEDAVLTIAGNYFGQFDEGEYSKAVPLPVNGMRLAPSSNAGTVYLFGGDGIVSRRLYAMHRNGQFEVLVELPEAVTAATDSHVSAFVATASEIYRVKGHVLQLVIRLPENSQPVVSLAASPDDKILYFATPYRVYALHGLAALSIVNDAGGVLRMKGGKLYLWDQSRSLLVGLAEMEKALLK